MPIDSTQFLNSVIDSAEALKPTKSESNGIQIDICYSLFKLLLLLKSIEGMTLRSSMIDLIQDGVCCCLLRTTGRIS